MIKSLNNVFPKEVGIIHFIGIGGIGMSGIAEILHSLGYKVQGSDLIENYVTKKLEAKGIKIFHTHSAENVERALLVVHSTAVKDNNPEIIHAKQISIPVIKRSDMLAEIMRFKHSISVSGTHGKTTTTSLLASIFDTAGFNPTVISGGIINRHDTNAYLGEGDYLIAEADESDGTFIKVPSYIGIVTNINPEHLDYYGTFENAKAAYRTFIENLPFYGFGVMCYDHPTVNEIGHSITSRRIIRYGIESKNLDIRALNIKQMDSGMSFDVSLDEAYVKKKGLKYNSIPSIQLGTYGKHNVLNSLAAITVAIEKNIPLTCIKQALKEFLGVKRRFTKTGEVDGITIIDDYAHHPEEIKATLSTARSVANMKGGKVVAVIQPHRYSRLKELMESFSTAFVDADNILVSDVYPAGETAIAGIDANCLIERIKANTRQTASKLDVINIARQINKLASMHDLVVFLGAGSITNWAYDLPQQLKKLRKS